MASAFQFRPSHTLLFVTPWQIARMDFSGVHRPTLHETWCVNRSPVSKADVSASLLPGDSLTVGLARAIQLGPKTLGRVTLVSSQFWTDVIALPADVAALANAGELRQALAIEAEMDSGLTAFESQVAYLPLLNETPNSAAYCVTQFDDRQLVELHQLLQSRNTRIHQLAHPIALLQPTELNTPESVTKLIGRWSEIPDQGCTEEDNFSKENLAVVASHFSRLVSERTLSSLWLKPRRQLRLPELLTIGTVFAVAALVCCTTNCYLMRKCLVTIKQSNSRMQQEVVAYESCSADLSRLEKEVAKLGEEECLARKASEATELQTQLTSRRHCQINARWGLLFSALAEHSADCWLRSIQSDDRQTVLSGVAMDAVQAHAFAVRLEDHLRDSGWVVSPATTRLSSYNLCDFTIFLTSNLPASPSDEARQSIVKHQNAKHSQADILATNLEGRP